MNSFCVLPWYSKEIKKSPTVCCLLPKNHNVEQIKQDLINGIKTPACNACWQTEQLGKKSRRQLENEFLDYKLNRDLDKIRQDCIENKHSTILYQINSDNLCNQACVSCNSQLSSKWASLDRKMNVPVKKSFSVDLVTSDINYTQAKRIEFVGGEPLYTQKTFKVLENMLDHGNRDCFVTFVTNGSVMLTSEQIDILSQFNDLSMCVSIDGIGPVFEYMRWPGKWKKLLENLEQYKKVIKNISVSYTISSLNAVYYDQTVEWFKQNNLRYNHNFVINPGWLSVENMPVEFKNKMSSVDNIIKQYCKINYKEISLAEIKSHIVAQDTAKKINIADYMPEVASLL